MNKNYLLKKTKQKIALKKYSEKTADTYLFYLQKFLEFLENKKLEADKDSAQKFLQQQNKLRPQTFNLILNTLHFFFANVQTNVDKLQIKYRKRSPQKIQTLSHLQIEKLLNLTRNQKHYLIFALSFGSGLKLNELTNLKIKDLDFEKNTLNIFSKSSRGVRETILPIILKNKLQDYISDKKMSNFLFTNTIGEQLSDRSLQQAFKLALKRAKINKNVSFQVLRHSFATHLLESGQSIKSLQQVLGHKNIRSTQKYQKNIRISVSQIKSPL